MRRIIRGYRKRNRLSHQLLAEVVYAAMYANPYRKHDGKSVADLYPMLFEDEESDESEEPGLSQEEVAMLQAEMAAMNAGKGAAAQSLPTEKKDGNENNSE